MSLSLTLGLSKFIGILGHHPLFARLLTEDETPQLSPAECNAACLQINQILTLKSISEKSHRIITDKILPDLERYGARQAGAFGRFWQGFFEASANVKMSGNNEESEAGLTSQTGNDRTQQTEENSMQTTFKPHEENDFDSRMADQTALDSPFENLKQDLRQNLVLQDARPVQQTDDSQQTGSSGSLRRPPHWHDLSMDSPDVTLQMPVPRDLSMLIDGQSGISLDSDLSMSSFIADQESEEEPDPKSSKNESTHPQTRKSLGHGAKILLHQALLRDTMIAANKVAVNSPKRRQRTQSEPGFHHLKRFLSRSKLAKTPSKEAARLVTTARFRAGYANPLDLEDIENEEREAELNQFKPTSSSSAFSGCSSDTGPSQDLSVSRALIDLREGDTQSSSSRGGTTMNSQRPDRDDPFNGPSTIKQRPGQTSGVLGGQSDLGHQLRSIPMDDSSESPPDSPTLFGIRHEPKKNPTQASIVPHVDPARPNNPTRTSQPFVPMRPEEMHTFFGGNLLESGCFEPCPLQGKRMRYTDRKDLKDPKGP
ncbi:hypothetical protein PSTG_16612 [Puccinia striiformis f. sp. tritici PST-78]|uniref:DASH complex subunit ASK1 n=1 Tax=Puccinia striiformis f. sp. tritici PST-78 TaxID=1165861 RepID=A0A0L0UT68_9BASI|nr:hypothetical protein PSTG_16612 [Puccinia striiformis f. sp. tritici PST-78]